MGMLSAMFSGVNGLNVHGRALSSVADNIANISTYAFKATRINFGDIMVQSLTVGGTLSDQVGTGARVLSVQNLMTQGSFETTDLPTDMAINGKGFFQVTNPDATSGDSSGRYYTRAGQFLMDKDGYMVNPLGYRLRGYNVDSSGNLEQIVEDIRILTQQTDAIPTSTVDLSVNLNAEDSDEHPPSQPIVASSQSSWNYMTTVRVYDSLGIGHDLSILFQKLSSYDGSSPSGSSSVWKASIFENDDGTLTANPTHPDNTFYLHFDTDGQLVGTSTGQPAYGDTWLSEQAFSDGTNTTVSNRVGETFSYTAESGEQTYVSKITVSMGSSWNESGDTFSVGSTTYDYSTYSTVSDLVAAINRDAKDTGIYANLSGSATVELYGNGYSSAPVSVSSSVDATITTDTLSDLMDAINNGNKATGALYLSGGVNSGSTISLDLGTSYGVVTIPNGTTTGGVVTLLQANTTFNSNFTATQTSYSIFIQANAIGDQYNITLDSDADSRLSTVANDTMAGGMDDGSTTRVLATYNPDGDSKLQLGHRDKGSDATLSIGNNTLGSATGIDLSSWEHTAYAADAQTTTGVETDGEQSIVYDFPNATSGQTITFDFSPDESSASTQSAGSNETFYLSQDGSPRGTLQGLSIDRTGLITGQFSNGKLRTMGAVVLADFANPQGLTRQGENLWVQSSDSGEPVINRPGSGGLGTVESGALEQSNVDLATEFVKMINYQRAFQANSKTISTTDQMLAELINLKR